MTVTFLKNAGSSEEAEKPLNSIRWRVLPLQKQGKFHRQKLGLPYYRVGGIHVGGTSQHKVITNNRQPPTVFGGLLLHTQNIWVSNCYCQISKDASTNFCSKFTSTFNFKIAMKIPVASYLREHILK